MATRSSALQDVGQFFSNLGQQASDLFKARTRARFQPTRTPETRVTPTVRAATRVARARVAPTPERRVTPTIRAVSRVQRARSVPDVRPTQFISPQPQVTSLAPKTTGRAAAVSRVGRAFRPRAGVDLTRETFTTPQVVQIGESARRQGLISPGPETVPSRLIRLTEAGRQLETTGLGRFVSGVLREDPLVTSGRRKLAEGKDVSPAERKAIERQTLSVVGEIGPFAQAAAGAGRRVFARLRGKDIRKISNISNKLQTGRNISINDLKFIEQKQDY
jgi:hypothetical protein